MSKKAKNTRMSYTFVTKKRKQNLDGKNILE